MTVNSELWEKHQKNATYCDSRVIIVEKAFEELEFSNRLVYLVSGRVRPLVYYRGSEWKKI